MLNAPVLQRGVSLIELMLATVIALIALSAVLSVYGATARHSLLQLENAHINQQMHALITILGRDLRRAGYRAFDPGSDSAGLNPFQDSQNHLRVDQHAREAANSCVLFAYDLDKDGLVGVGTCSQKTCARGTDDDNVEQFGYRLKNQRLQSRYGGNSLDCNSGNWQAISDPGIDITRLVFTLSTHCVNLVDRTSGCASGIPALERRSLSLQITGQLHNKVNTRLDLGQQLRVRNDRITLRGLTP